MQRGESLLIESLNVSSPGKNVAQGELCAAKSSPVQRSAIPFVCRVNAYPSAQKVSHADWLVTLWCYVDHIYTLSIYSKNICTVAHQISDEFDVAVEGCKMQGSETILSVAIYIYVAGDQVFSF